jgi:hypothetical protein
MKYLVVTCLLMLSLVILTNCSTPSDYTKACGGTNGSVREACDKPGQSEESQGYQPR